MNANGAFILSYCADLDVASRAASTTRRRCADVRTFDMTVLDEAHALKNPKAIRTRAV